LFHFTLDLRVHFLHLVVQLCELGIGRAELCVQIGDLNLQVCLFASQGLEQLGGGLQVGPHACTADCARCNRVRISSLHHAVEGLLVHALTFSLGEFLVEFAQLFGGDVLLFVHAQDF